MVRSLPKIGGTKNIDIDKTLALQPCLIMANKEENRKEDIQALREHHMSVFVAFPQTVDQAIQDLDILGTLLHTPQQAKNIIHNIQKTRKPYSSFRYAYLIWKNPIMTISNDCFIASMLAEVGGENVFANHHDRYPVINTIPQDIDALLLSSEPFPFRDKHRFELAKKFHIPVEKTFLIDGSYCSWHGSRIEQGLLYLQHWRAAL